MLFRSRNSRRSIFGAVQECLFIYPCCALSSRLRAPAQWRNPTTPRTLRRCEGGAGWCSWPGTTCCLRVRSTFCRRLCVRRRTRAGGDTAVEVRRRDVRVGWKRVESETLGPVNFPYLLKARGSWESRRQHPRERQVFELEGHGVLKVGPGRRQRFCGDS